MTTTNMTKVAELPNQSDRSALRDEGGQSRRTALMSMLGASGLVGLASCVESLANCVESDESDEHTETVVSAASGATVGWADAIGTSAFPLDLRTMTQGVYAVVIAKGFYSPGDGGGGEFHWTTDTTSADDGGTVIVGTGARIGCWKRMTGCKVSPIGGASSVGLAFNVKWFGARGDGVSPDRAAIQLAINACAAAGGGTVFLPPGKYVCDEFGDGTGLQVTSNNISIVGSGTGASLLLKQWSSGDVFTIGNVREVRFARFGIRAKNDSTTLVRRGACFNFNSGGIWNAIEDIHTLYMWDCILTYHTTYTNHNLRVSNVTCEGHKRYGAWLFGAIDPVINNLWTFHSSNSQGACVVYDSKCDGLILIGAVGLSGLYGVRSQNTMDGATGPRGLNASKCVMDNAGSACWSLGNLSYGRFDGCFAATQQPGAYGVIIASNCYDLHWTNARITNCTRDCVQINGANSISFIGGSLIGSSLESPVSYNVISVGLTAKNIKFKGLDIGRDPSGQLGGVPASGVAIFSGVRYFQIEGNNFIGCNPFYDVSGCPPSQRVIANNLSVPYP